MDEHEYDPLMIEARKKHPYLFQVQNSGNGHDVMPWSRSDKLLLALLIMGLVLVIVLIVAIVLGYQGGQTVSPVIVDAKSLLQSARHLQTHPLVTILSDAERVNRIAETVAKIGAMIDFISDRQLMQKSEQLMHECDALLKEIKAAMALLGAQAVTAFGNANSNDNGKP